MKGLATRRDDWKYFFAYKQTLDVPEWMDVRRVYGFSMPLEVTRKNKA